MPPGGLIQNADTKVLAQATGNKHTESELFLVSLHFSEELESIKTDFGSELTHNLMSVSLSLLM